MLLRVAKGIDKLWSHARDVSRLEAWTFSGIHLALAEDMPALSVTAPYTRFHHCRTLAFLAPEIRGSGEVAPMTAEDWTLAVTSLPGTGAVAREFGMIDWPVARLALATCNQQAAVKLSVYDYSCALCLYQDSEKQMRYHLDEGVSPPGTRI